ncbi:MAG: hypothetical protein P4L22_03715 [Candidatus Babeliales bacterium]|nr:hypothetical protein [Candidatus Babeliales bacterium]
MKFVLKSFFSILLLLSATASLADCNTPCATACAPKTCLTECPNQCGEAFGKTFFSYRPQDSNVARRMVGVIDKTHLSDKEEFYGVATLGLQYTETFENQDLARFLSFNDNTFMTYGPSCGAFDIYGLNFGTTGTNGIAFASADLSPAVAATTTAGGVCLNPKIKNFIAEVDLFTSWDNFVCGLWTRLTLPVVRTTWNLNVKEAPTGTSATGNYPINSVTCAAGTTAPVRFANLTQAWENLGAFGNAPAGEFGKLSSNCNRHTTALAGLHFELGYDFYRSETCFLGLGAHVVAPTGTTPDARLFFEPVAGANHSWQLGATVQAGYRLWENCDGNQSLALYLDSVITHLFASRQRRLFGLKVNGASSPGSSFLLLKQFNLDGTLATNCLQRAENLLAIESKIKADVMADLAIMLQYEKCNYSTGCGYNFWLRTKEKITENFCNPLVNSASLYAIKGSTLANNTQTQSTATIGACGNTDATSVFLTPADIDPCIALNSRVFSNKLFGFIGHTWKEREYMPFILLEAEVEFGNNNKAVDQWGVMLKGGISF